MATGVLSIYKIEKLRGSCIPLLFSFIGITLHKPSQTSCSSSLICGFCSAGKAPAKGLVFALAAVSVTPAEATDFRVKGLQPVNNMVVRYCKNVNSCVRGQIEVS